MVSCPFSFESFDDLLIIIFYLEFSFFNITVGIISSQFLNDLIKLVYLSEMLSSCGKSFWDTIVILKSCIIVDRNKETNEAIIIKFKVWKKKYYI